MAGLVIGLLAAGMSFLVGCLCVTAGRADREIELLTKENQTER